MKYLENLEKNNRHKLTIWPNHCLIGSWGNLIQKNIFESLENWEIYNIKNVNFLLKGSYPHSEHYSALRAEVPSEEDPQTHLNSQFITSLPEDGTILVAGQALDFCVFYTLKDLKEALYNKDLKIKLLTDCTNSIEPKNKREVEKNIKSMGIELINTEKILF